MTFWLGALIVAIGFVCCMSVFLWALCAVAKDVDDMIERRQSRERKQGDLYLMRGPDLDIDLARWCVEVTRRERIGADG